MAALPVELIYKLFDEFLGYDEREKMLAAFPWIATRIATLHAKYRGYPATLRMLSDLCTWTKSHSHAGWRPAIEVARAGDLWSGAMVAGKNIQWIELITGHYVLPGSRTYYRQPPGRADERRWCRYDSPKMIPDYDGVPLAAMGFCSLRFRCNPGGVIAWSCGFYKHVTPLEQLTLALLPCTAVPYQHPTTYLKLRGGNIVMIKNEVHS